MMIDGSPGAADHGRAAFDFLIGSRQVANRRRIWWASTSRPGHLDPPMEGFMMHLERADRPARADRLGE